MSKNLTLTPGEVRELGEATWVAANDYASKNGLGVTKKRRSGHLVTVKGGVSRFIKKAAAEINLTAYVKGDGGKNEIKRVREFLKEGYNVVALEPGDKQYEWRLFVSDDWNKNGTVAQSPIVLSRRAEADVDRMIDGESGPITETNLYDEFQNTPIGEQQAEILQFLFEHGGKYSDMTGFTMTSLFPGDHNQSYTGSFKAIEERGLVKRQMKNKRRFSVIALTPRGWWAAERVHYIQTAEVALTHFLSTVGSFDYNPPLLMTRELAKKVHKNRPEVVKALGELEDKDLVKLTRNSPIGPIGAVKWTGPGASDAPVADEDRQWVPALPEPVAASTPQPAASITRSQVDEVIDLLVEAASGGPNKADHERALGALDEIAKFCRKVELGEINALRAIVEIDEIAAKATA